jgi:hypothetical protein
MKLNQTSLLLLKGQTKTLKVSNASGTVKWKSSNASVVSVSGGKLTAKSKGSATITVTAGSQKKQCKVTVEEPKLSKTELTLEYQATKTLKLSGCKHSVKWSTGDKKIVTVKKGKLTAKGIGKTTVKAVVHGKTYSCKVTVKKTTVTKVKVGEYFDEMETDDSQQIEISTTPSSALSYYDVTVKSSDSSIVSADVVEEGDEIYIALNSYEVSGTVTITVSVGGKTASFQVEVVADESEDEIDSDEESASDDELDADDEDGMDDGDDLD